MTGISVLPLAQEEGGGEHHQKFKGTSRILGPSWSHLPALTIGFLGIQIFWSVEMSYASPYLLSLGLSKSKMAIVFVAGPLSGLVMQPLIGILADNCTSRFGRRRPYMIAGTIICMFAMILLGFTRWFASIFTGWDNDSNDLLTVWLAVLAIYLIDFSVNAIMAVDRALLVDTLPSPAQPQGNAWAARMLAIGAVVGFFVGNIDLPGALPFLGKTQLEVLSIIASLLLFGGHLTMAILIKERVLIPSTDIHGKSTRKSFKQELKDTWNNILTLPRVIRQICFIQFFAWLGWFPTLFYTTIYIGDLYKRTSPIPTTNEAQMALDAEATRLGSRALFWFSVVSLIGNVILPAFVTEATDKQPERPSARFEYGRDGEKWWKKFTRVPKVFQIHLANLWAISHLVFAGCMLATLIVDSVTGASFLITVTGFSWAVTQWAPFSLLGTAILTEPTDDDDFAIQLADTRTPRRLNSSDEDVNERDVFLPGEASGSDDEDERVLERQETTLKEERRRVLSNSEAQVSRIEISRDVDEGDGYHAVNGVGTRTTRGGGLSAKAGIILGIHNISIVIPQFLVTGFSSIMFAILDPQKTGLPPHHHGAPVHAPLANATITNITETMMEFARMSALELREAENTYQGSNSIAYIFRLGGVAAAIAAVLSWRLARELRRR